MRLTDNIYGNPINYPNSENIRPPVQKVRKRVVEPATRTEVSAYMMAKWNDRLDRYQEAREQKAIAEYREDGSISPSTASAGSNIDFEV